MEISFQFPEDYLDIVSFTEYVEIDFEVAFVSFFPINELVIVNEDYEFPEFAPSYLPIGTNGSGVSICYRRADYTLYSLPLIGLDEGEAIYLGSTLKQVLVGLEKGMLTIY